MMHALLFIAVAIAVWLVLTWYFADDQPAFGPGSEGRVTFKQVVMNALGDVADLFAPVINYGRALWAFWVPRATNTIGMAAIALDAAIVQIPELHSAILANKYGLIAILAINLVVYLSPKNAPARLGPVAAQGPGAAAGY